MTERASTERVLNEPLATLAGHEALVADIVRRIHADAASGGVVVCGPAGIGKSAIVAAALDRLEASVGRGKIAQFLQSNPLEPIRQALREAMASAVATQPVAEQVQINSDAVPLSALMQGDAEAGNALGALNRLLEGALTAATAMARLGRPVVLAIDDLQWADGQTLALLGKLLTFGPRTGFFIVASSRAADVGLDAARLFVPRLDSGDAMALVASRIGGDTALARCIVDLVGPDVASTPFQLRDALRTLETRKNLLQDPDGTWRLVAIDPDAGLLLDNRLAKLDASVARLLAIAACLGDRFGRADLAWIAGRLMEPGSVEAAVRAAVTLSFLTGEDDGLGFAHDLYREAAGRTMPTGEARRVHIVAAELFCRRRAAGGSPQDAVRFASHALEARISRDQTASWFTLLADAAECALSLDDPAGALRFARYGLQPADVPGAAGPPRAAILRFCIVIYRTALPEEARTYEARLVAAAVAPMEIAFAFGAIATRWFESGENGRAVDAVRAGLAALGSPSPRNVGRLRSVSSVLRTWYLAPVVGWLVRARNAPASKCALADAEAYLIEKGVPALYSSQPYLSAYLRSRVSLHQIAVGGTRAFSASSGMTVTSALAGRLSQARRWARRTLDTMPAKPTYGRASALYRATFFGEIWRVPFFELAEVNRRVVNEAIAEGDLQYVAYGARNLVQCLWFAGDDLDQVAAEADAAASLLARLGDVGNRCIVEATRQAVASLRDERMVIGEVDGPRLSADVEDLKRWNNWDAWCICKIIDLRLRVATGDLAGALDIVREMTSHEGILPGTLMHPPFCALAVVAYGRAADLPRARRAARTLKKYARECPRAFAHLYELANAELALAQGRAVPELYDKAVKTADALGRHFDRALIHGLAVSALAGDRALPTRRFESQRHAEAAAATWYRLGALRLARPSGRSVAEAIPIDGIASIAGAPTLAKACQLAADVLAGFCGVGIGVAIRSDGAWQHCSTGGAGEAGQRQVRAAIEDLGIVSGRPGVRSALPLCVNGEIIGAVAAVTAGAAAAEVPMARLASCVPLVAPLLDRVRLATELAEARGALNTGLGQARSDVAAATSRERVAAQRITTLLATVSHELRSPLAAIGALIETWAATSQSRDQAAALHGAFLSLRTLVDDLLDVGCGDPGRQVVRDQPANPADVARAAARIVADQCASPERPLLTDIDDCAVSFLSDPQRLQQILINLLSNAYRHAATGSVRFEVRFEVGVEGRSDARLHAVDHTVRCLFTIEDEGPGLHGVTQERLFAPFSRSVSSPGVGLGLAVSWQLARALGGVLTAANRSGAGARFLLDLPLRTARAVAPLVRALRPIHVMLVDDLQLTRDSYTKLLTVEGWHVQATDSGERALEAMAETRFDLVLLDFQLPGWDGLETLRRIRELLPDSAARPPVILFTAMPTPGIVERALAAGADAVLPKPATRGEIVRTAATLLDRVAAGGGPPPERLAGLIDAIGPEHLDTLLADAMAQLPNLLDDLGTARDREARRAAAHRLHGFATHFGLADLAAFASDAEAVAEAGNEMPARPEPPPAGQTMAALERMRQAVALVHHRQPEGTLQSDLGPIPTA